MTYCVIHRGRHEINSAYFVQGIPNTMSEPFPEFRFIFPPRPRKGWLHPTQIRRFPGYVAQPKYHGWRVLVYFFPDGSIRFFNRRGGPTRYRIPPSMMRGLKSLSPDPRSFQVLDGELLHFMAAQRVRDTLVLFDLLVHKGSYLLGTAMMDRYELLASLCGKPKELEKDTGLEVGLRIRPHLWLAPNFTGNLGAAYKRHVRPPLIEGLILKNPKGRLQPGLSADNNGLWQLRIGFPAAHKAAS